MYARRKWAKLNSLGSAKKQWMKCVNHLRNGFQGETLFQVHEAVTTSYQYHHPKLHTSYRVKTSLMLVLVILIFPQLSNCVISDQWYMACLYNSFWWVGLVTQVDVEQGDVKVQFMFPMGHVKHLIDQKLKAHAMCQSKTFFVRYLLLPQQLDEPRR